MPVIVSSSCESTDSSLRRRRHNAGIRINPTIPSRVATAAAHGMSRAPLFRQNASNATRDMHDCSFQAFTSSDEAVLNTLHVHFCVSPTSGLACSQRTIVRPARRSPLERNHKVAYYNEEGTGGRRWGEGGAPLPGNKPTKPAYLWLGAQPQLLLSSAVVCGGCDSRACWRMAAATAALANPQTQLPSSRNEAWLLPLALLHHMQLN